MKESYTCAGITWGGYVMAVRFGAPLEVQTRLLAAAEDAERQENAARGEDNSMWLGEPHFTDLHKASKSVS